MSEEPQKDEKPFKRESCLLSWCNCLAGLDLENVTWHSVPGFEQDIHQGSFGIRNLITQEWGFWSIVIQLPVLV